MIGRIQTLRWPRLLAAFIVGISFAVSGALMQGVTNNPMASPSILGINAGASFGLAIAMIIVPAASLNVSILFAFLGAALGSRIGDRGDFIPSQTRWWKGYACVPSTCRYCYWCCIYSGDTDARGVL